MTAHAAQAIFGGTFNPIHNGHLRSAQMLFDHLPIDHLRFVPAHVPPHREAPAVQAEDRAAMVELAIAGDSRLSCDRRELGRSGPSYTVDTLESLRCDQASPAPLALVMGCDAFLGLESWYRWEDILGLAHLVVMARPGWTFPTSGRLADLAKARGAEARQLVASTAGSIVAVELEPWDVSSTEIRALLQSGEDVAALVPEAVVAYAKQHQLYA